MLDRDTKKKLEEKSEADFIELVKGMSVGLRGKFLYRTWNAYCECRCNDDDQLFDFEDNDDRELWSRCCGEVAFSEKYGIRIVDFGNKTITTKYLSVDDLFTMSISSFEEIYQHVLKEPLCFDNVLTCLVLNPVLKEIGILNPHVVGFDKEFIHDSLL